MSVISKNSQACVCATANNCSSTCSEDTLDPRWKCVDVLHSTEIARNLMT